MIIDSFQIPVAQYLKLVSQEMPIVPVSAIHERTGYRTANMAMIVKYQGWAVGDVRRNARATLPHALIGSGVKNITALYAPRKITVEITNALWYEKNKTRIPYKKPLK